MSVTFSIESLLLGTFSAECYNDGDRRMVVESVTLAAAEAARDAHIDECRECAAYGLFVTADFDMSEEFDVNLANTNARRILIRLGDTSEDLVGSLDAETFLASALIAEGTLPAEADLHVDSVTDSRPGGATVVECGRPAGYESSTLGRLITLANEARRLGRAVVWA